MTYAAQRVTDGIARWRTRKIDARLATIEDDLDSGAIASGGPAASLDTTGAAVDVSAAAPPTTGDVLTATSATTATWQAPGGVSDGDKGDIVVSSSGAVWSLDATVTRTGVDAALGLVAATAVTSAYFYVSGNGAPGQFVQILSGDAGEAELRLVPGAGVDSQIVHVGSGGGDLDIKTTLGGNVYVNKATDNVDFTASGLTVARLLHVDAGLDQVGIGTGTPVEILTVSGRLALAETTAPTATAGVGKIYVKASDGHPYYMDDAGNEKPLTRIENRTSDPVSPAVGEVWLRTDL